jgi:hypothetical protein
MDYGNLVDDRDVLGKYHEHSDYIIGKDLSNKNRLKEDILRLFSRETSCVIESLKQMSPAAEFSDDTLLATIERPSGILVYARPTNY